MESKGVFRRYEHLYYSNRRKLPPTVFVAGDVSVVGISQLHPRNNLILRDSTFRTVIWIYYSPDRRIATALFVPGVLVAVQRVHPSRSLLRRDTTFRQPLRQYYRPKHVLPPSQFVPGITNAPQKVHPRHNPRLRNATFRPPYLDYYQPKRVLHPSQFIPGVLPAKHPRLRNVWSREVQQRYYRLKRVLPPIITAAVDVSFVAVQRTHPSRNLLLRQRYIDRRYYEPKRAIYTHIFIAGIIVLISKVHPSRNIKLRDRTFRPPYLDYYQPKRVNQFTIAIVSTGLTEVLFKGMWRGMYRSMR